VTTNKESTTAGKTAQKTDVKVTKTLKERMSGMFACCMRKEGPISSGADKEQKKVIPPVVNDQTQKANDNKEKADPITKPLTVSGDNKEIVSTPANKDEKNNKDM